MSAVLMAIGAQKPLESRMSANPLQCVIQVAKGPTSPGSRHGMASVKIKIRNAGDHAVDFRTIPSLEIGEENHIDSPGSFWAPIDFRSRATLAMNDRAPIQLAAGEEMEVALDATQLGWDQSVSSRWPSRSLFEVVPAGNHWLWLDIWLDEKLSGKEAGWHIRSVAVPVSVSAARNHRATLHIN